MSRGGAGNLQQAHARSIHSGDNHSIASSQGSLGPIRSNRLLRPVCLNGVRPVTLNGLRPSTLNGLKPTILGKKYYSTGRGGAGNMFSGEQLPLPHIVSQGENFPKLSTAKVTTGRGGWGNMIDNTDPEITRKLQDVDGPPPDLHAMVLNKLISVGRGGFGNITTLKLQQSQSLSGTPEPNLYTITLQGNELKKKRNKSFLGKIKEIFGS